jgi:hypothetical protein
MPYRPYTTWLVTCTISSWISVCVDFGWEFVWLPIREEWWPHEWMQNKSFWCHLTASAYMSEIAVPDRSGSRGTVCVDAVNQSHPYWQSALFLYLSRCVTLILWTNGSDVMLMWHTKYVLIWIQTGVGNGHLNLKLVFESYHCKKYSRKSYLKFILHIIKLIKPR